WRPTPAVRGSCMGDSGEGRILPSDRLPREIAFALLGDRLAIDAAVRERGGLESLEGDLDAAIGTHSVGAFLDAPQRRAKRPPFVDVAHRFREIDLALGEDRTEVAGIADAV